MLPEFEFGNFSVSRDMTSQSYPSHKGSKSSNSDNCIYPRKIGLTLMSRIVLFYPKLRPPVIFSNFQAEEIFSFSKFSRCLDEERTAATPLTVQFC